MSDPMSMLSSASTTLANPSIDFVALLKDSQAISRVLHLDDLLQQLTQLILQQAGGDRCVLLLPHQEDTWFVEAIASPDSTQLSRISLAEATELPVQLIQYVRQTQEPVVLEDLTTDLPVIDEYLSRQAPQSLLCLPLSQQGELKGIVYVSHQASRGHFSRDRLLGLNLLCHQAAISLTNAQLFQSAKQTEFQLQQSNAFLKAQRESSLDGILVVDPQRKINACNQCFLDLWQVPPQLRTTQDDHAMLAYVVDQVADSQDFLAQVIYLYDHIHESSHCELLLKDGRTIERTSVPVTSTTGENWGRIWYFRDISDRKAAEAAIQQKSQELQQALEELQQAQLQVVQNEKMLALGNLVAGVAHEINNPIGCIIGNVGATQDYINDLLGIIDLYQQQFPQPSPVIEDELEAMDLDYLREDLPKLMRAMREGGERIKSISRSLRNFSRADADTKQAFDLYAGIDSTLLILRHRLKANAERPEIQVVIENFPDGKPLPLVHCFPGQLNQVFMNILANAIDMFDEMSQGYTFTQLVAQPQAITIQTRMFEEQVQVSIRDNGKGMPEEVQARIFDHLFTTKEVGKGTGLGLAIARQIVVEKHGGSIQVNSVLGQGTEFLLSLPLI